MPIDAKPNLADIRAATGLYYGLKVEALRGTGVPQPFRISHPRQLAVTISRRMTRQSYPSIGRFFGVDHTTAIYAVRATERRIQAKVEVAAAYAAILEMSGLLASQRVASERLWTERLHQGVVRLRS